MRTVCKLGLILGAVLVMVGESAWADDPPRSPSTPTPQPSRIEDFAPASEFIQVGSIKTHVVQKGSQGPAIVLIHGFGASTHTWRFNVDVLARHFRVYAVDLKGFGLTEKPKDGQYHLAAYTQHLLETLDRLKVEKAVLVGNSMGGAVVARLALLHPERVAGVVLVDAAPIDWGPPSGPLGQAKKDEPKAEPKAAAGSSILGEKLKVALARTLITRKGVEAGLKSAYHDTRFVDDALVDAYYKPFTIDGAPEALLAMMNPPPQAGPRLPALKELKPPALIIWGRHDRIIPVQVSDRFARELPRAKKVIFENSGHLPQEEEADRFNALLAEFAMSPR